MELIGRNGVKALRKLDKLLKNSKLSEEDIERIGAEIKAGIARRHAGKMQDS